MSRLTANNVEAACGATAVDAVAAVTAAAAVAAAPRGVAPSTSGTCCGSPNVPSFPYHSIEAPPHLEIADCLAKHFQETFLCQQTLKATKRLFSFIHTFTT